MQADEIGNEQEQATHACRELPWGEGKIAHIGNGLNRRTDVRQPLIVAAARQAGEALSLQHLANGGSAEGRSLLLEGQADLVDRVVPLAQSHNLLERRALLGLRRWSRASDREELGQLAAA